MDRLQVDKYVIEHNLEKWNMSIAGVRLKGLMIQVDIVVPYAEMILEVIEKRNDSVFFNKNTARVSISDKKAPGDTLMSYLTSKTVTIDFGTDIKYVLFDTPYFYPHNWYLVTNKDYLYKKIAYSVGFMQFFIQAYKDSFQTSVPLIHVKHAREYRNHYEIDLILKEYLTISYVKTDLSTATLFFHLLLETDKKNNADHKHMAKFHQVSLRVPRDIRTGNVHFKFTANVI